MTPRRSFEHRLARAALRLYPPAFRAEFGDELTAFVEALAADERFARGAMGRLRLALYVARDTVPTALSARARAARAGAAAGSLAALPSTRSEDRMDTLLQDLRYAVRSLVRLPALTVVAVVTLMLGIGANTAIFSIVRAVLLRPLPYPQADRLAMLWGERPNQPQLLVSVPDFQEWRARNRSFDDLGVERTQSVNLTGIDKPDRLIGNFVDAHTLRILGAKVAMGRLFADAETTIGTGQNVAVLANGAWQTRFGGDPGIVGRSITLNGRPFVVIGVLAADYHDPYPGIEVYLPITSPPSPKWLTRDDAEVWGVARLRPGVTVEAAQRDLAAITAQLAAAYPEIDAGLGASVLSLRDSIVGNARPSLIISLGAAAFVLLIACANVANLLLARAAARRREISVRAALGAGRSRLVRQLLTESLTLSVLGGLAGVLMARWGTGALVAAVPGGLPVQGNIGVDGGVLLFSIAVTVGAGLLFGAAPAVFAVRANLNDALGSRSGDGAARAHLDVRSVFVAVQLALCIVLLVGSALLVRSLQKLMAVNVGFDARNVLTAEYRLPSNKYSTPEQISAFMARAIGEVRAVQGIRSAALVGAVPLSGNWSAGSFIPDSKPGLDPNQAPVAQQNLVSDGFFATMGIPMLAGRDFDARDRAGSLPVVVVSRRFAESVWPGQSPIGRRVELLGPPNVWATVIGEVGDVKQLTIGEPTTPQLYAPVSQKPTIFSSVVARTDGDPDALAGALRAAIWRVDPDQPVWKVRSLESLVDRDIAPSRFIMALTAAFALLALALAAVGVYGVMAYAVTQRTREVGIRMALGAPAQEVVRLVLSRGVRVVVVATIAGAAAAYGVARLLAHQLFGVAPADPLAFTVAPAVLVVVALLACWLPARRAARVDPVIALRAE